MVSWDIEGYSMLTFYRAPFYNYIKIAFVIYLEMQGSEVIYNRLVKEVLQRHETEIEVGLRRLKGGVYDMGVKYIKLVYNSFSQQQQQQDEFIPLESEQEQSSNISQLINSYAPTIISDQLSNQLKRRGAKSNDQQQQQQQPKQQNAQPTKPKQSTQPDQNASSWLFGYL